MITLNWKPYEVLGCDYYYTFYEEKFICVKADYVVGGVLTDSDFILEVTVDQMDPKTKEGILHQMIHLFPELELIKIKKALRYHTP
jgi:hypothetical protein